MQFVCDSLRITSDHARAYSNDMLQKPAPLGAASGQYAVSDAGSESSNTSSVPHGIGLKSADAVAVGDLVPVRSCACAMTLP